MHKLDAYLLGEIQSHVADSLAQIIELADGDARACKGKADKIRKTARAALAYIKSAREMEKNPTKRAKPEMSQELQRAVKLYSDFHGEKPKILSHVKFSEIPKNLLQVGKCLGIMYQAKRDGRARRFLHEFRHGAGPTLAASPNGRALFLLGGSFVFTEDGIEDIKLSTR